MENKIEAFEEILLHFIRTQKNSRAISIIKNSNLHHTIDNQGKMLLHYAAFFDNSDIAQYLIDNGCNVNAKDYDTNTPLLLAIHNLRENVIKILLNSNAEIDNFKRIIESLLYYTPTTNIYLNILKLLLVKVVSNCLDIKEKVQKLLDMSCPFPAVIILENSELTKFMLQRGCKIDESLHKTRETALHLAVHFLDIENFQLLIREGASTEAQDYNNRIPLARFELQDDSHDDKLEIFNLLLCLSLFFNMEFRESKPEVVNDLLRKGDKRTILVLMSQISFLQTYRGLVNLLHQLLYNKKPSAFDIFKEIYFRISLHDQDKSNLLAVAITLNDVNRVQWFLDNGARINLDNSPVTRAMFVNDMLKQQIYSKLARKIFHLLLEHDLDVQPIFADNINNNYIFINRFDCVKPIFEHLAMIVSFGVPLKENVDKNIKSDPKFVEYFELCKQRIEEMKSIIVYESVTLFELLGMDKKKMSMYAQNHDFVRNYEVCMKNNKSKMLLHCYRTLNLRVGETINLEKLREKVANVICKVSGLPTSLCRTIVYDIVLYLDNKDLENMLVIDE